MLCLPLLAGLTGQALAQTPNIFINSGTSVSFAEGYTTGGLQNLRVNVTQGLTSDLTVNYTMGGTATAGTDYTINGGTVNYSAGTGTFTIPSGTARFTDVIAFEVLPTTDNIQDPDETIIITITAGTGYGLGSTTSATFYVAENTGDATFELSGNPWVGETLTLTRTADDPDGNGTVAIEAWQRKPPGGEWVPIRIQDSQFTYGGKTYVVRADDLGMQLRVEVHYTDGGGLTKVVSTPPVGPVEPAGGGAVEWNACVPPSLRDHVDARIKMASTDRWTRIKNALTGRSNAIPLAEVREIHDRRLRYGWTLNRLDGVIAALECMARALPSNAPVISISAGDSITEGGTARFTLTADPAPTSGLTVAVQMKNLNINVADDDGDIRTRELTIGTDGTATLDIRTLDDSNRWPNGTVYVAVQPGTSYRVASEPNNAASVGVANDDFVQGYPTLSVADATVSEGARNCVRGYFTCMKFTVTLSRALTGNERVDFLYETRESSPRTATAREDFYPRKGPAKFKPGDPLTRTIEVHIYDDAINDSGETFELAITHAWGATIADGVGVGTITNDDPLPAAWLARFGRAVAEQALDGITARMAAPRTPGLQGMIAGQSLDFSGGGGGGPAPPRSFGPAMETEAQSRTMTMQEVLRGTSFSLTGEADGSGGTLAFWGGRPGAGGLVSGSQFAGNERGGAGTAVHLSGETSAALLGTDYARGPWLLGFALSQSRAKGSYAALGGDVQARTGDGDVEASLTATIPYAALAVSERLKLWGAAGHGSGDVTVKTAPGGHYRADTAWSMAAAGLRGDLLAAPAEGTGPSLALVSDALWVRTSSDKTQGLAASESDVSRLRLGLEGSWSLGAVTPSLALGARHDGGDAETGFGMEVGGGLAWRDPGLGLTLDLSGRTLIAHDDEGLEDRGVSAQLAFDPDGASARGLSLGLTQDWGGQAASGLDALFADDPLEDRAGSGSSMAESRWQAEAAYGFPAFSGRFTGSPHMGLGLATGARDYTLGWRLEPAAGGPAVSFGVQATRRESDGTVPEHTVGFEINARW